MNNTEPRLRNRIASFQLSFELVDHSPEFVSDVFAAMRFVPLRLGWLMASRVVLYCGLSHLFDPVPEGVVPPFVRLQVVRVGNKADGGVVLVNYTGGLPCEMTRHSLG